MTESPRDRLRRRHCQRVAIAAATARGDLEATLCLTRRHLREFATDARILRTVSRLAAARGEAGWAGFAQLLADLIHEESEREAELHRAA